MSKRAFTLIEIVMVLVILAMLAAMAISKYGDNREQAKIDLTRQNLQNLRMAIDLYFLTYQAWPNDDLSNVVFVAKGSPTWGEDRKYIEEIPIEAITDSHAVRNNTFIDGTGGWLWDDYHHVLKINLFDHPTDTRKKYSEW